MQKVLLAVFAIIFLAGCGRLLFDKAAITWSDGRVLLMDVARTQEAREQGLSGREDIGDGMIFCFEDDAVRYFWMYDMRVPLDVVWLRDGSVVGLQENIPVMDPTQNEVADGDTWTRFSSEVPANAAIELPSGMVSFLGIRLQNGFSSFESICR